MGAVIGGVIGYFAGGVDGAIAGALIGYAVGYAAGSAADYAMGYYGVTLPGYNGGGIAFAGSAAAARAKRERDAARAREVALAQAKAKSRADMNAKASRDAAASWATMGSLAAPQVEINMSAGLMGMTAEQSNVVSAGSGGAPSFNTASILPWNWLIEKGLNKGLHWLGNKAHLQDPVEMFFNPDKAACGEGEYCPPAPSTKPWWDLWDTPDPAV